MNPIGDSADSTSIAPTQGNARRPRIWPAVIAVAAFWCLAWAIARFVPGTMDEFSVRFHGARILGIAVVVWWLGLSRLPWKERLAVFGILLLMALTASFLAHSSLTPAGLVVYVLPYLATAWAFGAAIPGWLGRPRLRTAGVCGAVLAVLVVVCLLRFDGIYSTMTAQASWRWTRTPEERYLESQAGQVVGSTDSASTRSTSADSTSADEPPVPLVAGPDDWPAFRGPNADSAVDAGPIHTDWSARPPRVVWRRPIGPGWSSFLVVGDRLFTQEQRGPDELITCLDAATGRDLWTAPEPVRYDNPVSGSGPRGTPTFHEGRVYALGATGRLRCVDARTGRPIWSRDVRSEAGADEPMYGFCGSPLVADGLATVIVGGPNGRSVVACRADTGEVAWMSGEGTKSYGTVQRELFDGEPHYLCVSDAGLAALDPATGDVLWRDDWAIADRYRIVQPRRLDGNRVLYATGLDVGLRMLEVKRPDAAAGSDRWSASVLWTENEFKPYFNDFVLLDDVAYGYDGSLLSAFSLQSRKRLWKRRGHDAGQALLLKDRKLLLVLAESGEAALVSADPKNPRTLGTFKPLEGKTWNHPVVSRGRLFLRNATEAACYDLRMAEENELPRGE